MNSFAIITPTRGDRKPLVDFLRSRVPTNYDHIIVSYPPTSQDCDLVPRIREGINIARARGAEYVVIAEDDDFYPLDYFDNIDFNGKDFFGYQTTNYYNLANRTYQRLEHVGRSSLFCTGFKIEALDNFHWPHDSYKWLDIKLWEYCHSYSKTYSLIHENHALGIKGHGIGQHAGKGHTTFHKNPDPEFNYLKDSVDEEAFKFYQTLIK